MDSLKNKIEAIIFISENPVKLKEIASFLKEDLTIVKENIKELIADWEIRDSSINIQEVANGYQFRTKHSVGAISVLTDRELIKVIGEKEVPGRPYLYSTTDLFLEVFSLNTIKDLPNIEEFESYEKEIQEDVTTST